MGFWHPTSAFAIYFVQKYRLKSVLKYSERFYQLARPVAGICRFQLAS